MIANKITSSFHFKNKNLRKIITLCLSEKILNDKGKIDPLKLQPITYDSVGHKYLKVSEVAGNAFEDGKAIK